MIGNRRTKCRPISYHKPKLLPLHQTGVGPVLEVKRVETVPHLAFEKAAADRSFHAELLHGPRSRAANFITNKTIPGSDTESSNDVLQLIRTSDIQDKTRV